mmetsp:Transcript_13184/g.19737  ORF Transcript_13184/g.19737 Transcript_13184/m.19737 type:complete len:446 (+) Transcript_13184:56-1393(+)
MSLNKNDETPLLVVSTSVQRGKEEKQKTSNWGVGYAIAKTIDGAGVFSLPWACNETGVLGFIFAMIVCVVCGAWTMGWLCRLKRACGARTYEEIARLAAGNTTAKIVKWLIWFCVIGVCGAYVSFLAAMIPLSSNWFSLLLAAIGICPLAFIVQVRYLAKLARFGIFAVFFALLIVICTPIYFSSYINNRNDEQQASDKNENEHILSSIARFGRAFGSIAFLFCVHFTIPTIEDEAATPEQFPRVAEAVLTITGLINLIFGLIARQLYSSPSPIIIQDIQNSYLRILATMFLALDLLTAFPIVFNAALASNDTNSENASCFSSARIKLLCLVFFIAARHSFVAVAGFVGGLGQASLALVLPPVLVLLAQRAAYLEEHQHSWISKLRPISQMEAFGLFLVAILGFGLVLATTATSFADLLPQIFLFFNSTSKKSILPNSWSSSVIS